MRRIGPAKWLGIIVLVGSAAARAVPPELTEYAPPDALVSILVDRSDPGAPAAPGDAASGVAVLLASRFRDLGLIPGGAGAPGLFVDIATALPAVTGHPWAVTLLDVASTPPSDGGRHLADLRAGLIVLTRGRNEEIERQIRRALAAYTSAEFSKLTERPLRLSGLPTAAGPTVYELRDSRLPEWAVLSWGAVGDAYVVTVGRDTFDRIVSTKSKPVGTARAEWLARARRECRSSAAVVEWIVDFVALRKQLENAAPREVFDRALAAFGLDDTDLALWTVGAVGREITCYAYAHRRQDAGATEGADRFSVVAGPEIRNPLPKDFIPPEASIFAVFDHRPATLLRRLAAGYLAICREDWREKLRYNWDRLQERTGVQFQRDVLDQLGDRIVVHTWPPHPLGISALCTVELEISGLAAAGRLRRAVDILLGEYGQYLDEGHPAAAGDPFSMRIKRDEDGVWYLQAGIYGPALTVTDRWLVISFSPQAVRQNAAYLSRSATASQPASQTSR
jgi:hypothetical protein